MPLNLRVALFALALGAMAAPPATAQTTPFAAPEPRIARGTPEQPLTGSSSAPAADIVLQYLRSRVGDATVQSLEVVSQSRVLRTGVTHVRLAQRVGDLRVYGVQVKAAVNARGELTSLIENVVPVRDVGNGSAAGAERAALAVVLRHLHGGQVEPPGLSHRDRQTVYFERTPFFHREPSVTRVLVPVGGGALRTGYLVETWTEQENLLHHTLVGGEGAVLGVEARTNQDSYRVFPVDPEASRQTVVRGPGSGNEQSPQGWLFAGTHTTVNIAGNNAHAYLDGNADNVPDAGGTDVTDGDFLTAAELDQQPSVPTNRNVAVQNLFYLNNVIHDRLYTYGFTEAAGNFQEQNFGAGGAESDSVNAEAQDGSGLNNANFATPADGSNPRMQMFLWSGTGTHVVVVHSPPSADGSYVAQGAAFGPPLDMTGITADVVLAEDGAGVSTSDACERMPRNALDGVIALVDRGTCNFDAKVLNAQRAGAVAVIVVNNQGDGVIVMGGSAGGVRIPSVMIGQSDGDTLKEASSGLNATVRLADEPPLSRDSALDSDIVWHEYGHGLTWRMIGNMSGPMSGAIGEGMSDVLAVLVNDNDVVAEYSSFSAGGIRSAPYTDYPRTYGDFSGSGVHFDGEIYGAIGWRLREIFEAQNESTDTLLAYLVDGMNYTPAGPAFEDMRDGILQAVIDAGLGQECLVWQAFADYGVGVGAGATIRGPNVIVTESFDLPASCPASPATLTRR